VDDRTKILKETPVGSRKRSPGGKITNRRGTDVELQEFDEEGITAQRKERPGGEEEFSRATRDAKGREKKKGGSWVFDSQGLHPR